LSSISKTDRDETGNGKLNWAGCRMKNLKGIERIVGGVWKRPVKIKETTINKSVGTLREIEFAVY
jgi:hypothetical protein